MERLPVASAARLFWELSKRSFQRAMTYRAAIVAGLVTNLFFGLLRAAVLKALYGAQGEVNGITLQGAITYTGLSQAVIGFLSIFNWYVVMNSVYTGEIAGDMLKPMNIFNFWLAQDWGRSVLELILRGIPIMLVYGLLFDIALPGSGLQWFAFGMALVLGWLVGFAWRFLVNLAAFWTPNALGIGRFAFILSWFLSGFMIPLRLFPEWFARLCQLTPFPYTVNTIVEVYLGVVQGMDLVKALALQAMWVIVLIAAGQFALRAGVRRLVIQGG